MLPSDSPSEILDRVKIALKKEFEGKHSHSEIETQIQSMTKAEIMDKYFNSFKEKIDSFEICRFIKSTFNFDLDILPIISKEWAKDLSLKEEAALLPLSRIIIDLYLKKEEKKVTGTVIRRMINQIFGINLDAISSLEGTRISLYSKGLWVLQHAKDLFVVETGEDDKDVRIYPTKYFTEQTGLEMLHNDLQHKLSNMGYNYDEETRSYYYRNPAEEAVPDAFKGQTMGAILNTIKQSYANL